MKLLSYGVLFFMLVHGVVLQAKLVGPDEIPLKFTDQKKAQEKFMNDSVVNMSDQNITVQVQFHKIFNVAEFTLKKEDLKKYSTNKQVNKTVTYVLGPKKSLKMYEAFIKANQLNDKSYWLPSIFEIATQIQEPMANEVIKKQLTVMFDVKGLDMVDDVIESKKYSVNVLNNELQVEIENKVKP